LKNQKTGEQNENNRKCPKKQNKNRANSKANQLQTDRVDLPII